MNMRFQTATGDVGSRLVLRAHICDTNAKTKGGKIRCVLTLTGSTESLPPTIEELPSGGSSRFEST